MRKFLCVALGAVCLFCAAGIAACGDKTPRDRYVIEAEYAADTRTLTARMTATVANPLDRETDELKFQLWANAYRKGAKYAPVSDLFSRSAYYAGESYGGMTVSAVEGAESFEVCGEDENILSVKLGKPLKAGGRVSLGFSFEVALALVNHRLGVTRTAVNLGNFYPVLCRAEGGEFAERVYSSNGDPFVSGIADFDVTLTLPEEEVLVSGFPSEAVTEEGKTTHHVRAEGVRDIAFVFGNFSVTSAAQDGVEIFYYYPEAESDPARTLTAAERSLACFSEMFGEYEYPRYTVVMTDFVYGGMEFPALSMISSALRENELPAVVAHETAHQWWYSMVGSDQYNCAWQDEGLAEFSSARFLDQWEEYGQTYADFVLTCERSYRAFFSISSQLSGETDTAMNRPLTSFSGDYEYRNIAYDKAVILFDRVKDVAGERKFTNALKRYFRTCKGKIATCEDIIVCFEREGANVRGLFESFLEGKCVI